MPNSIYSYQSIDPTECMGDSLTKINNNNFLADGAIGTLETRIVSVSSNLNTNIISLSTVPYARLNDGNQSGAAPLYGIRAWVVFDGTGTGAGTPTIYSQGNVSGVSRVSTGTFDITFTVPLPSTNYAVIGTPSFTAGSIQAVTLLDSAYGGPPTLKTTSQCRIQVVSTGGASNASGTTSVLFIG